MDQGELQSQLAALHPASHAWAVSCCGGDRDVAEDVLQTVYLRVLNGRACFREGSSVKTWLFSVIRNVAREERRRRWLAELWQRRSAYSRKVESNGAGEPDETGRLRRALSGLSARQREVLHLVFYEDLSLEQAATVMRVSLGTARKHYARAKNNLREALERT